MTRILKGAKALVLGSAKGMQGFRMIRESRWRSEQLLILAYHGISIDDEHEWDGAYSMSQGLFRQRMEALRQGSYSVLPLGEAIERLYAGDLPPRAVTLTFDDGLHDFRVRACPVLAEFGYPATVYLTTYFVIHRYPVFNMFFPYLLWKGRGKSVDLTGIVPGLGRDSLVTPEERLAVSNLIREYRKNEAPGNDKLQEIARNIAKAVGQDYERLCGLGILHLMTPPEVSELARYGVSVQLHTHRHRVPFDQELFAREIRDNRNYISSMGVPNETLIHFCYPSGEYRPEFFDWLKDEGMRSAATCETKLASSKSLPFALPRLIDTSNLTPLEFEGWLTGISQFLPRR